MPDMTAGSWQGVFVPTGTPPDVVAKLYATMIQVMETPDVRKRLAESGVEVVTSKSPEAFAAFLREDLTENAALIERSASPPLEPGDVVFFHCRTFHAAGANRTDHTKLSLVFTYHATDNRPLPGSRSASLPSVVLHP